jgi:hypothetical protein
MAIGNEKKKKKKKKTTEDTVSSVATREEGRSEECQVSRAQPELA